MNTQDLKNIAVLFAIARKELHADKESIKEIIRLEEKLFKHLEDEFSGDEADNGDGSKELD